MYRIKVRLQGNLRLLFWKKNLRGFGPLANYADRAMKAMTKALNEVSLYKLQLNVGLQNKRYTEVQ
jgi:hypothetical protein